MRRRAAQPVGNLALSRFDVLVIGSGAGGAAVAHLLTAHGKKVLVLEAGANHFEGLDDATRPPSTRFSNDELKYLRYFVTPDPLVDPRTWRQTEADGPRSFVGEVNSLAKTVGGGAVHADLKMPRFLPQDFHLGTALGDVTGASFADWPVDYAALEPFYTYVEKVMGVQGQAGVDPFEGQRSAPFPMPPGLPMYGTLLVNQGLASLGYHPFPFPAAVNSRPYDGRPPCVDCGYCSGFGCPSHAKGSPAVTTLRRALLSGNCQLLPQTKARRLIMSGDGTQVMGVAAIGPDGAEQVFTADQYVLAASPIEDARLLLLSDPQGAGVGNSSGLVGRNLMFHFETDAVGIFDERLHGHRGRAISHGFNDFRGVPGDASRPLAGIVEISGSEGPLAEARYYTQIMRELHQFDGARLKKLMRQSPLRDRIVVLSLLAEDAPQPTNRIDLDPEVRDLDGLPVPRVTYKNHAFELSARDFYAPKLLEILGAAGARYGALAPPDEIPTTAHIMGTLRFGADPKTSVCDATGRLHDVGNLSVADGALFPTSSGFNPTLTIVAVAMRVAGEMLFPGSPEKALS
jgi:choline dehydrogenase-like flavoprotein